MACIVSRVVRRGGSGTSLEIHTGPKGPTETSALTRSIYQQKYTKETCQNHPTSNPDANPRINIDPAKSELAKLDFPVQNGQFSGSHCCLRWQIHQTTMDSLILSLYTRILEVFLIGLLDSSTLIPSYTYESKVDLSFH